MPSLESFRFQARSKQNIFSVAGAPGRQREKSISLSREPDFSSVSCFGQARFKRVNFCVANGNLTRDADVVVIGGGPGGYVCAIRSAQLGLKTVLVERDQLGGICVAYGCIPSKALISTAKLYEKAKEGASFGIVTDGIRVDLPALQKWKAGVVSTLETGV